MQTTRNFLLAGLLASLCLAPVVSADASRVLNGHIPALLVRDLATSNIVSTEPASGMGAALPHIFAVLAGGFWQSHARR